MTSSPLVQADAIYAPFDRRETKRLRQFVQDVEELAASSFFNEPGGKITISGGVQQPLSTAMPYAGEEAVRAVVGIFRQLFNHNEPTSTTAILNLLAEHVRARSSPAQQQALLALKALRKAEREIVRADPMLHLVHRHRHADGSETEEVLTPRVLIDLFLHGHYLHKGNEKADKLDAWPMPDMTKHVFFTAMTRLRNLYWGVRNVVREVLKHPDLIDQPLTPGSV